MTAVLQPGHECMQGGPVREVPWGARLAQALGRSRVAVLALSPGAAQARLLRQQVAVSENSQALAQLWPCARECSAAAGWPVADWSGRGSGDCCSEWRPAA